MNSILKFLYLIKFVKIHPSHVSHFIKKKNISMIEFYIKHGDFKCRTIAVSGLKEFNSNIAIPLLKKCLNDHVQSVVIEAINSLHSFKLDQKSEDEISYVLKHIEKEYDDFINTWHEEVKYDEPYYVDKSKMVRYQEFKQLVKKIKWR